MFRWFVLLWICCLFVGTDLFLFKSRSSTIKIGSFNLRRYSLSKASPSNSNNKFIVKILQRYDLIFLQEIIDSSKENRVVNLLLKQLNHKYQSFISPPLGSTSYKERLVFLSRSKLLTNFFAFVYNGSSINAFERAPFLLQLKFSPKNEFLTFIGVHLKPENVYNEFRSLRKVIDELKPPSSIVVLGDFNADCSYLNNAKKNELRKNVFNDFQWLIDDHTETNLLQSCSYDRILISSKRIFWKPKTNKTFPFDQKFQLDKKSALQISDHYPVEVDLY